MDDKEPFLSRWSRRKLEAKENTPVALAPAQLPAAAPGAPPVPAVPAAEPATPGSPQGGSAEYRQFFDPQVDEKLRQTALRGLFSDPHFNVMDGLDTYIDDYSLADPIPAAMLRQLNQAKALFLFDDEKKSVESEGGPAAPAGTAASPMAAADTSAIPEPPPTSASDEVVEAATGAVAAVPVEGSRNN